MALCKSDRKGEQVHKYDAAAASGDPASVPSTSAAPTNKGKKAGSVYESRTSQTLEALCSSNSSEHTSSSDDNLSGHGPQSQ